MSLFKKCLAEVIGTCILVVIGCGAAIALGCGTLVGGSAAVVGTAAAFGLAIVCLAYSIGHISGGHVNPAVSLAMAIRKDITWKECILYVIAQLVGAAIGCLVIMLVFGYENAGAFGANAAIGGEGATTAQLFQSLLVEAVLTFIFVSTILGVTSKQENGAIGGIVIGLALFGVHLVGINLTGTSVNPARSLLPAIFAIGNETVNLSQVWIFILGPLVGGALAGLLFKALNKKE